MPGSKEEEEEEEEEKEEGEREREKVSECRRECAGESEREGA